MRGWSPPHVSLLHTGKGYRNMLKKLLIAAVAVMVGLVVLRKTELGSLMRVWWKKATVCARNKVPIETEIESLREQISQLDRSTKEHFSAYAEEAVAVDNLEANVKTLQAKLEEQERSILTMRKDLKSDTATISYGDNTYSRDEVTRQLKHDWEQYQRGLVHLKARKEALKARKQALQLTKEQSEAMKEARSELVAQLDQLEAELKTVRLAQTRSHTPLDDSDLSQIKDGVSRVRDRIRVEQKKLEFAGETTRGPIRVHQKSTKNLLEEIDNHFGKAEGGKVAAK